MDVAGTIRPAERLGASAHRLVGGGPRLGSRSSAAGELKFRLFDIVVVSAAILVFLPVMVVLALLIRLQDGGPVIFAHSRIGRDGALFRCWKFRSMVIDAEARLERLLRSDPRALEEWKRDHKLKNDPRITCLGRFIRATSLDELPQLFNVLVGDMSVVGPRPIVHAEISRYGRRFFDYCRVRPGITGLWQVSGRNDVSYRRRVAIDTVYARSKSLMGDLSIVLMTVPAVLLRRGSY